MTDLDLDAIEAASANMCHIFTVGPRGTSWRIDDVSVRAVQAAVPDLVAELREARAAIAAARALHTPQDHPTSEHYYCDPDDCDRAGEGELKPWCWTCGQWAPCATAAALDVRHDPSATTTIPIDVAREHAWLANYALEMLVDTGDGTYHPIADALAKVRDLLDPSATTEPPQVGARIRIVADGVVTAYDSGSDAVQLDHQECWWPYSGNGVSYSTTEEAS